MTQPTGSYQDRMREVERRRAIAQALMQQGMQPQIQQSGRFVNGPNVASMIGGLASTIGGNVLDSRARKEEKTARSDEQARLAKALEQLTGGAATPQQSAARDLVASMPIETQQQVVGGRALESLFPKPVALEKVDLGEEVGFADPSGNIVRREPKKNTPKPTDDEREWTTAKGQGYTGTLQEWIQGNKRAGATTVSLGLQQEKEEDKAVGKAFGEKYVDIQNAGFEAAGKITRLDRMEQLLSGVETGKLTPVGTEIAGYAKSLGFDIDPNLSNKEAAQALSAEMTLQARNPSGGAGMPGAMSDADRQFLAGMAPNLAQTPEGRAMLIDTQRKLAKRDQEVAQITREYRRQNGKLDEGWYDALAEHAAANPMFGGAPSSTAVSPQIQSLVDKYKSRAPQ